MAPPTPMSVRPHRTAPTTIANAPVRIIGESLATFQSPPAITCPPLRVVPRTVGRSSDGLALVASCSFERHRPDAGCTEPPTAVYSPTSALTVLASRAASEAGVPSRGRRYPNTAAAHGGQYSSIQPVPCVGTMSARTTLSQPMPGSPEQPHRSQNNIAASPTRIQLGFRANATAPLDPSARMSPLRVRARFSWSKTARSSPRR